LIDPAVPGDPLGAAESRAPLRILLVVDNPADARMIRALLRDSFPEGFELERVDREDWPGERPRAVDAILLDVGRDSGAELLERARSRMPDEPIIVLTEAGSEDDALAAVRAGAQDSLVKSRLTGPLLSRVIRYAIERKRSAVRLEWLTLAVEQSPAAVLITDPRGIIQYVNSKFTEISGYTAAEAIGQSPRLFKSGLTPPEVYHDLWSTIRAGGNWHGKLQNRRKSGELYWDAIRIWPMRDARDAITHFVAVQEDITGLLEAEAGLRESERRARNLFDTVHLIVLGLDSAGRVDYVNPFFLQLTGYTREEVIGQPWIERFLPPEHHAELRAVLDELRDGDVHPHYQNPILTRSGERRMISWSNTVLRDTAGQPTGTLSIGEDVTDARRLQEQLLHSQKMESLGRLAGGVAHDFNNLLTAILSNAEFLREDLPGESPLRSDVDEIRKAAERAAILTRQLLSFSRRQVVQPRLIELNDVALAMDKLLRRLIGEDIELVSELSPDPWAIWADAGQIEQVLANLTVNSRDAMPDGGRITIETANVTLSADYAAAHVDAVPGDYVMLAVSDTGHGIPEDARPRIFDPFFTTKPEGKGTGLGLATVHGIVHASGGHIWVYSEPGHGATFKLYFPRASGTAPPLREAPQSKARGGTETVLIVEDEAQVLEAAIRSLGQMGYTVVPAQDGLEGLRLCEERGGRIDLLLTDIVMPRMGGKHLARLLQERFPRIKVLYTSGYTGHAVVLHDLLPRDAAFLAKPYVPAELVRKVREVLDAPAPG
jgi:two-component system cell cycle sensor histidine kinase/response regulator CckA